MVVSLTRSNYDLRMIINVSVFRLISYGLLYSLSACVFMGLALDLFAITLHYPKR